MRKRYKVFSVIIAIIFVVASVAPAFASKNKKTVKEVSIPEINSPSAVLYCINTGETLYEKSETKEYKAGNMSKVMTAIVGVQKLPKDKEITVGDVGEGAIVTKGEKVSLTDLLNGIIVGNSESCSNVLAETVAGSKGKFTEIMNSTAKNIGCKHTEFSGPAGYGETAEKNGDNNESESTVNYGTTTLRDITEIGKIMVSEKNLRRISETESYVIKGKNAKIESQVNRNDFFGKKGTNGIQYSVEAKQNDDTYCSLIYYDKNGLEFLIAIGNGTQEELEKDASSLIDFGEKKVRGLTIIEKNQCVGKVRIKHGAKTGIKVYAASEGLAYLPKEASKSLVSTRLKTDNVEAPIKKDDIVGNCEILVADEVVNVIPVYAGEGVNVGWLPSYLGISNRVTIIICVVIILFVSLLITRGINKARMKKRRKKIRQQKINELAKQRIKEEQRKRYVRY